MNLMNWWWNRNNRNNLSSQQKRRARSTRPVLEVLEDRLAPAYAVSLDGGLLSISQADASDTSHLIASLDNGIYTFSDTGLTFNTATGTDAAKITNSTTSITVANTDVSKIRIDLGDGNDVLNLGTFDDQADPLTASGGGDTGDQATVSAGGVGLKAAGDVSISGFQTITVNAPIDTTASPTGAISLTAGQDIALTSGSSITSVDGDITLRANTGDINVDGGTIQSTGSGSVSVEGDNGVIVQSSGTISAGGSGSVSVFGLSNSNSYNSAVVVDGAQVTSAGGAVSVKGFASTDDSGNGVLVQSSGTISAGSGGSVSVEGTVAGIQGATIDFCTEKPWFPRTFQGKMRKRPLPDSNRG